jgi:hypothetical protein
VKVRALIQGADFFKAEQEEQAQGQGHPANPGHRRGDADAFRHYANKASEQGVSVPAHSARCWKPGLAGYRALWSALESGC